MKMLSRLRSSWSPVPTQTSRTDTVVQLSSMLPGVMWRAVHPCLSLHLIDREKESVVADIEIDDDENDNDYEANDSEDQDVNY